MERSALEGILFETEMQSKLCMVCLLVPQPQQAWPRNGPPALRGGPPPPRNGRRRRPSRGGAGLVKRASALAMRTPRIHAEGTERRHIRHHGLQHVSVGGGVERELHEHAGTRGACLTFGPPPAQAHWL